MHKLEELKKTLCAELEGYAKRGNNLDLQSLSTIDVLAHAVKNLDKIIKGEESGYSNTYYPASERNSYEGGWSSKGRGYSYGDTMESFKKLIESAPDEQTKNELNRLKGKFE